MAKPWIISNNAKRDIAEILDNVIEYTSHTSTGVKLYQEFLEKFDLISALPRCGKVRADNSNTREIFARSYRIVYQEFDKCIQIIAVVHSRRLYPKR